MNKIIAKKVTLIQKNPGVRIDYTHVTEIKNIFFKDLNKLCLVIQGETDGPFEMRKDVYDKFPIENLELMIVEFYIPKI